MQPVLRYLWFGLAAAIGLGAAYALGRDLAVVSLAPFLRSWDLVLLAALCSLLNYGLRIVRWQHYLARLGHSAPLKFTGLAYAAGLAFTVSPGKVGELARARYYSRLGIPVADTAGAFGVERLMDLAAMLSLATLILGAVPHYHAAVWIAGTTVAAALMLLTRLPWSAIAGSLASRGRGSEALSRFGHAVVKALAAARSLLQPGPLLFGFCIGLVAWGLEGFGLCLLSSMFPPAHVTLAVGVGIYAVAVLAGAISFLPGGLGSTEAVMTALFAAQGYPVANALLITIICRLVTLWLAVGIGWVAVLVLRHRWTPAVLPWQ